MSGKLPKIIIVFANVILWVLLVFTAYGGMVSPALTVIPAIAAMTFPIFLALTILVTVLCLFFYRLLGALNIGVLLLCGGPILSYCPFNIAKVLSTVPDDAGSFTLMSYNVLNLTDYRVIEANKDVEDPEGKADANNGATLRYVLQCAPDIAALQECFGYTWDAVQEKHPALTDSLKTLYPYIYAESNKGFTLMSRYPFEPIALQVPEDQAPESQAYRIDIEGHPTYLISVHLQSIGLSATDKQLYLDLTNGDARSKEELKEVKADLLSKLGNAYRRRAVQADSLREALAKLPGNVIVCGDFNDIPDSYVLRTFCGDDMRSAFREAGCGPGISFHADRFYFRIDHCLYRGSMTPVKSYIPHNPTSDHFPLITTFVWDKEESSS